MLISQQSISEVKALPPGSVVTTTGIITTGAELGVIRYLQDAQAGIAIYSKELSNAGAGDSIVVTGVISVFKGQLQISPVITFTKIGSGLSLPAYKSIQLDSTAHLFEAMLVQLECVGVVSCEPVFENGWYRIFDSRGRSSRMIIPDDVTIKDQPIPATPIAVSGVWIYKDNQYQLLTQNVVEVSEENCTLIRPATVFPIFGLTGMIWTVSASDGYFVEYGIDDFTQHQEVFVSNQQVEFEPNNLISGQLYQVRLGHDSGMDTTFSLPTFIAAPNPENTIEIFFNRSVDSTYSDGSHPDGVGTSIIETDVIERIDAVTSTLDIAMYNSSRSSIIQAVNRAVQRGVTVRYLAEEETGNSGLQGTLTFPVLFRSGDGIMHNKFIIGDADDVSKAWLWTGSTNHSANQLATDPNNAIIFHDQAMALNYRKEFDEFWGSNPAHKDAAYGEGKDDNTAHLFFMADTEVESYFSPSDETSCHIMEAVQAADHRLDIGLLLMTMESLVDAIIDRHLVGVSVRVILEDEESSSLAVSRLRQAGVSVLIHDFSNIFHHKYAIIDEGHPDDDPVVITGSHNWTFSADHINDENTLIIHDQSIANIYRQEFEARWKELGGTSTNAVSDIEEIKIQPNPASGELMLSNTRNLPCMLTWIDAKGAIANTVNISASEILQYAIPDHLPDGTYLIHWKWRDHVAISKLIKQ